MTGSSTSSSTWMLPALLLLPLFISIQQSSSATIRVHCERLSEFNTIVDKWGENVKNCWTNCSSAPITHRGCQCINITVSPGGCSQPGYFIRGLRSLDPSLNLTFTSDLIKKLETMDRHCNEHVTSLSLECDGDVISPKTLHKQLEALKQRLNDRLSSQTQ